MNHCADLQADRELGEYWERQFCAMMADCGKMFTALQIGREDSASAYLKINGKWNHLTLPDVTIWTCPGEHHEVKHKTTTNYDSYGLERYRLEALVGFAKETQQSVQYTIHDHHGQRDSKENRYADWLTANVVFLGRSIDCERWGSSYFAGTKKRVKICYWPSHIFRPLIVGAK